MNEQVSKIISLLDPSFSNPVGLGLWAIVASWVFGKGILILIKNPSAQKALVAGLKTAEIPGALAGRWIQAGPLRMASAPILCLMIFAGFWFFSFIDAVLKAVTPESRTLIMGLEKILERAGSSSRLLYVQSKTAESQKPPVA